MIIFTSAEGPKIDYQPPPRRQGASGVLTVEDVNPQVKLVWRMARGEMLRIGVRCVIAALKRG